MNNKQRNKICHCGSGKKFKYCCLRKGMGLKGPESSNAIGKNILSDRRLFNVPHQRALQITQRPQILKAADYYCIYGPDDLTVDDKLHVGAIYRFFQDENHANELIKGNVWLSTLGKCRQYENSAQGDKGEGEMDYHSGEVFGDWDDPAVMEVSKRLDMDGPGATNITISNNREHKVIHDAYVLCTTEAYSPQLLSDDFGKHCVRITDPVKFFKAVSDQLFKQSLIKFGVMGKIIYMPRIYRHLEHPPGPIGFVKPPDKYSNQKEIRLLWFPSIDSTQLQSFSLNCPEIIELCEKII